MRIAIMQPYFFPYIGYFQTMAAVDKYIVSGNVTFIKDAWMNRNRVVFLDGSIHYISVPLLKKSSNKKISEILIDNTQNWQNKVLQSVWSNYRKAPYFEETYSLLDRVLSVGHETLFSLNASTMQAVANHLDMNTEFEYDFPKFDSLEEKLRTLDDGYSEFPYMEKTRPARRVARILEMCRQEGCDEYINAIGGMELYDKEEFAQYGISLSFVKTRDIVYGQCSNSAEFVPNLSIVDVLMNNGREKTKFLLKEYDLV